MHFGGVIPSCFHFVKMCLCQACLLSRCSPRYLTSSWGISRCLYEPGSKFFFRMVNLTWADLDPLAFILHFLKSFGLQLGWFEYL
jgi:hypothetical protein